MADYSFELCADRWRWTRSGNGEQFVYVLSLMR